VARVCAVVSIFEEVSLRIEISLLPVVSGYRIHPREETEGGTGHITADCSVQARANGI
jgi:hypothetical protein